MTTTIGTHTHTHTHMRTDTHTHTHIHAHAYTHTHTHTHRGTHIHTVERRRLSNNDWKSLINEPDEKKAVAEHRMPSDVDTCVLDV